jgi:hypothetical protein
MWAVTVVALLGVVMGAAAIATANAARPQPLTAHQVVPVLGAKAFAPGGSGFGTAHPKRIDNGGDPSGIAFQLTWTAWGHSVSKATGKTYVPRAMGGGFYKHPGRIQFRASDLGRCSAGSHLAYRHLHARVAARGKSFGKWFAWGDRKSIC